MLLRTPGLHLFSALPLSPVRGLWATLYALYAAAGDHFYQVFDDGTFTPTSASLVPTIINSPVQIFPNQPGTQLFIVSAGQGYVATGTEIDLIPGITANTGAYLDGFFIAAGLTQMNLSAIDDAKTWDPTDYFVKNGYSDHIESILTFSRNLYWVFGTQTNEVFLRQRRRWLPSLPMRGVFNELGCIAQNSPCIVGGNAVAWIVGDTRGNGVVVQANGYTPARISNHAVENAMRAMPTIQDAITYSYQDDGHPFLVCYFPTADQTWVYDQITGLWHERRWWDPVFSPVARAPLALPSIRLSEAHRRRLDDGQPLRDVLGVL